MIPAAVVALLTACSAAFAAPSISVSLAGEKTVTDVDNFKVLTKVTNSGDKTLTLLNDPRTLLTPKWNTKTFHITNAEGAVPGFKGVAVKWSPAAAVESKSFTVIEPGHTVEFEHVLGGVYDFTNTGAGAYEIVPTREASTFTHVADSGELASLRANIADAHSATLKGKLTPTAYVGAGVKRSSPSLGRRVNTFYGCSSTQQSDLRKAAANAQTYADTSYAYLTAILLSTPRYTTWFGTYISSRKSTVQSHFSKIRNGQLANDAFDCSCTEAGVYAYVYPNKFGYIYLCPAFWAAPAIGTDSKAGTLVHESSHFTANGGTEDYAYGQPDAKALAINNPDEAIMNADNHEYFAENTPPLL